ncbi:unnamed protein product, partial [Amoebophrya sp. A25]
AGGSSTIKPSSLAHSPKSSDESDGSPGASSEASTMWWAQPRRPAEEHGDWAECVADVIPRLGDSCVAVQKVASEAIKFLLQRSE